MCLILLIPLLAFSAWAQEDVVSVGNWRVHEGDDPRWAQPEFDDSTWESTAPPRRHTFTMPFFGGIRWYRGSTTIPQWPTGQQLAIGLSPLDEVYDVFVEGVRVGRFGQWDPKPAGLFERHLSFPIPVGLMHGPEVHIAIRRWTGATRTNFQVYMAQGIQLDPHAPRIGPAALIATEEKLHTADGAIRYFPSPVAHLLIVLVGIASLALFSAGKNQKEYLWLGLTLIFLSIGALAGIAVTSSDDLLRRSLLPSLLPAAPYLSSAFSSLLLANLCSRLKRLLWISALFQFICALAAVIEVWAQWGLGVRLSPTSNTVSLIVQALVAVVLLTQKRTYSTALAGALLFWPLSRAWFQFSILFGMDDPRYINVGRVQIDTRDMAGVLFAVATLVILYLRYRREQERQVALDQDLAAARRVQELLLGGAAASTPGFAVDAVSRPAREVGGDFYQALPGADGSLLVAVGDVSGKGLEAAMVVATLVGALRGGTSRRPGEVLGHLNRALSGTARGGFVTCCCALFHPNGQVDISNAGHLAPYLNGREVDLESALPLGIDPDSSYTETRVQLHNGALTILSDGVVEAANNKDELFGFDRTRAISGKPAQEIAEAAQAWGQNDDVTVLTVRRRQ